LDRYEIVKEEIIPGSLEDFCALMHEVYELQPGMREDSIFLQGERTPSDYPRNMGRWEVTLGGTLQQRGFIIARQLSNGTTKLQFAYSSKFRPIGKQFEIDFIDNIMRRNAFMNTKVKEFPLPPEEILQSLRGFFSSEEAKDEIKLLRHAKAQITQINYDNWNGGTYYYCLHIQVSPSSYRHIADDSQAYEYRIQEKAQAFLRPYPNYILDQVCITPSLSEAEPGIPLEEEFIKVAWTPDDFYKKLIDEINQVYAFGLSLSLSVLIRKLFENLIIDVLRRKYGTSELELYYNPSKRRFQDFSVLLKNFDSKLSDFHYITSSLDKTFVRTLNSCRETGNSAAHSIDTNLVTIELFEKNKEEIDYAVQLLLRVLQNI